jgi:predicted nucleic acid-binding protein
VTLVVDASVAICWFTREEASQQANSLIRANEELIAPSLICAEVANTAWKKFRRKEMTEEQAAAAAVETRRFIRELAPAELLTREALNIAFEIDHSVYDCIYLALAVQREATFVTLDEDLLRTLATSRYKRSAIHLADWRPA